jgi:large subunit ribosomal protein L24
MHKLKIRKGDKVQVIAGQDKGKKGSVLAVNPTAMKIKIEGVKVQTHYDKKDGLLKKEGFIDYSNVKLVEKVVAKAAKEKKATVKKTAAKSK